MKKHSLRFFLSVAFLGLVGLAFNPQAVVDIQTALGFNSKETYSKDTTSVDSEFRTELEPDWPEPDSEPITVPNRASEDPVPIEMPNTAEKEAADDMTAGNDRIVTDAIIETPPITEDPDFDTAIEIAWSPKLPITRSPDLENLPLIDEYEIIKKGDSWIGTMSCGIDIFDAPLTLSGVGPRSNGDKLKTPLKITSGRYISDEPTYTYKAESGPTLRMVQTLIEYYSVSGTNFDEVQKDIFDREPLQSIRDEYDDYSSEIIDRESGTPSKNRKVILADLFSTGSLSYVASGLPSQYDLIHNDTEVTVAFVITLPRWPGYEFAPASDQAKWDDVLCNAAHHELGHLRIRLDILAETLNGYGTIPTSRSPEDLKQLTRQYRDDITNRINIRQDAYHIYNDGGVRRGMTELPYAELPFPWLVDPQYEN